MTANSLGCPVDLEKLATFLTIGSWLSLITCSSPWPASAEAFAFEALRDFADDGSHEDITEDDILPSRKMDSTGEEIKPSQIEI